MSFQYKSINFTEQWIRLQEILESIFKLGHLSMDTWDECFGIIHCVCNAIPISFKDELYDSTKLFLKKHLLELLSIIQSGGNAKLLQNYHFYWERYTKNAKYLNTLYHSFNGLHVHKKLRYHDLHTGQIPPNYVEVLKIEELCLDLWKQNIIIPLKDTLSVLLLDEFDKQGRFKSTTEFLYLLTSIMHSFVVVQEFRRDHLTDHTELNLYQSSFEQPFLEQSGKYFKCYAEKLQQTDSVFQYLLNVSETLEQEETSTKKYFFGRTYHKLLEVCRQNMVRDHLEFFRDESEAIMKEERQNDMRKIYLHLYEIKDGLNMLADIFREHVEQRAFSAIESIKQEQIHIPFVEDLLALHKYYKTMVVEVLKDDPCFNRAVDKAFEEVINHKLVENQTQKSPEYLSLYCDYLLRKSTKDGLTEADIDYKLTQSLTIFRYIHDKDAFKILYQKHLANRLIHQQSRSMDAEEKMVNNLDKLCGSEYTTNFHRMLIDLKLSEKLNGKFRNVFLKFEDELKVVFSASVLETGARSFHSLPESTLCILKQLISCTHSFGEFYHSKYSGRRLKWIQFQGELELHYLSKVYTVTMQPFQMAILLLFEDNNTLKYSEIRGLLEVTHDQHLQKYLKSLVECKLLLMDGDNVSLNMAYFNEHNNFCISTAVQKDNEKEPKQTINNSVEDNHEIHLQTTIVQIMKHHTLLKHDQLLSEILTQSKTFTPTIPLVDKCIEALIYKGYLEQTPNVTNCYSFIA